MATASLIFSLVYKDWIPTYPAGFSSSPTVLAAREALYGKQCHFWINATNGTSSGAGSVFQITLPYPAANNAVQSIKMRGTDNGAAVDGCLLRTVAGSSTANVYPTGALGTWAAGSKNVIGEGTYEIL